MEGQRSIFGPLLLITAGVMWLLIKSGALPGENLWALTHIWPYLLIAAGAGLILRNYWRYASVFVDVLIIGGLILAILFAPRLGWADPSVAGGFWNGGVYLGPGESGSGRVVTETREVSGFDSIEVDFPAQIVISQGRAESVKVKGEDNFLPGLKTEVRNGALEIFYNAKDGDRVNPTEPVVITIVVKDLTDVDFTSAGELTIDGVKTDRLDISLSGAGNVKMTGLAVEDLSVVLSGAGSMTASGLAETLSVEINGFGSFNGGDLQTAAADVVLSGAGSATVWADESLDAEISGAGSVNYYGDAAVTKQIGGLGGVKHLGDK